MSQSLIGVEIETGGIIIRFLQTAAETRGELHSQEARYPPSSAVPPLHRHPYQEERFTLLQGSLCFRIIGADRTVRAEETITIPKGVDHFARNAGDVPAIALWETRPALRTAEFFAALGRAGKGRAKPRLADAVAILAEFRDEIELTKPAPLVQRLMFGCIAPFGRRALEIAPAP